MDKLILKQIAKRWCKAILMANDITDEETIELLSEEEQEYLLEQVEAIANRITDRQTDVSLNDIIKEYYSFENES
jgi:ribosomal protein L7Ae-like RNA K-turn-binding protein